MLGLKDLPGQGEGVEVQERCAQKLGINVFKSLMSQLAKALRC